MRKTSGLSLMLLIFLSLSLIVFSLLSLSGAQADETLSRKAADRTTEYYAAVSSANEVLAKIDDALAGYLRKAAKTASSGSQKAEKAGDYASGNRAFLEKCAALPGDVPGVTCTGDTASFSVPVNEKQVLFVELALSFPQKSDDTLYRVTAWETVNTKDWTPDRSMELYRTN